jgi:hypothetical protein
MVRRSRSIPLPEPASLTNSGKAVASERLPYPATLSIRRASAVRRFTRRLVYARQANGVEPVEGAAGEVVLQRRE